MSTLPPLYAPWITDLLGQEPAPETHATCDRCAMCEGGGDGRRPRGIPRFDPRTKCCTYQPVMPNFLVGGVLSDEAVSPAGAATMRARLAGGAEVTPLGVGPAPGWKDPERRMGDPAFPCPHLDDGRCSVWAHRHAVCATWWCKHEAGARGHRAWVTLRSLLLAIERSLSLWCCVEAGLPPKHLHLLVARAGVVPDLTVEPETERAAYWGDLVGQEEAFYMDCYRRVRELSWADVLNVGGPAVRALALAAKQRAIEAEIRVPDTLRVGVHRVVAVGVDGALVETYSAYDPVLMPALLQSLLHTFDGRPTAEILRGLREEQGVELDPELLTDLLAAEILVG